jgi:hypothetical protein
MLWRFLKEADEKLPWLGETQTNISVHIVGLEFNPNGLRNNVIHISGFSGEEGGWKTSHSSTSQKTAFFIVTAVKTSNPTEKKMFILARQRRETVNGGELFTWSNPVIFSLFPQYKNYLDYRGIMIEGLQLDRENGKYETYIYFLAAAANISQWDRQENAWSCDKLIMALATIAILGPKFHGTNYHISTSDGSGNILTLTTDWWRLCHNLVKFQINANVFPIS